MASFRTSPKGAAPSIIPPLIPLPPFAIRELNGPAEDGTLQITPAQYDDTIVSYPDATLTYLDEDDGETITVGSSLELKERLDEPIRLSRRPRRRSDPLRLSVNSDQKIHIFDINRTAENLLVWQDHAAYSSKTLRESSMSTSPLPTLSTDSLLPQPHNASTKASAPGPFSDCEASIGAATKEESSPPTAACQPDDVLKGIDAVLQTACRGFESHIGGFAAFLDLTAGALRTAAEKTRDADTTPVENFLSGMKTVLVEAGQMGLELLRELDIDAPARETAPERNIQGKTDQTLLAHNNQEPSEQGSPIRVSFNMPESCSLSGLNTSSTNHSSLSKSTTIPQPKSRADIEHSSYSSPNQDAITKLSHADVVTFEPPSTKPERSLMDVEAWNADFAIRYPPLNSLRRAKTVGVLRKPANAESQQESGEEPRHTLSRYPTIGQIDRTNRQERIARLRCNRTSLFPRDVSPESASHPEPSSPQYKRPSVEDANDVDAASISNPAKFGNSNTAAGSQRDPPGAWPERAAAVGDSGAAQSPASVRERMTRFSQSRSGTSQPKSPSLSCRTTSPLADPFHPAVLALRRAKTVTASNPAARLNGPFDPLSGAPGPLDQAAAASPDPFSQFTLPQRSLTQHLPAAAPRPPFGAPHRPMYPTYVPAQWGGPRPVQRAPPSMPRAFPYPPVPQARAAPTDNHFLRHMQSEPNFAPAAARPSTDPGVTDCISSLRAMGYGSADANEDARLPMYASATFGNVSEAVEMIEEDRRAAKAILSRVTSPGPTFRRLTEDEQRQRNM